MEEREKLGITNDSLFVSKRQGVYVDANVSTANTFAHKISSIFKID